MTTQTTVRYASYSGAARDFSWGECRNIRKGDIVAFDGADYRMVSLLATPAKAGDWSEVASDVVELAYRRCDFCRTWIHRDRLQSHRQAIHERLAIQPAARKRDLLRQMADDVEVVKGVEARTAAAREELELLNAELAQLGLVADDGSA